MTDFLRSLAFRRVRGVEFVICDMHEGRMAAVAKILHAASQRCWTHTTRNLLVYAEAKAAADLPVLAPARS